VRIDTDAAYQANSGISCALNLVIGGFNNRLTVQVALTALTQVVESFLVGQLGSEVPGGLSLPALREVGGTGGCGAAFRMAKLAVLDLPALTTLHVCGLAVDGAPDLTTLKLGALALVEGELLIQGNPKLSDISGIACGARIAGDLIIKHNPQLSTAAAQALANCLQVTGTVTIEGNKLP
jgi:hypothetical protein